MIETICLAADAIMRLNNSTIIVQTQDPWAMFWPQATAIFVGAIAAFITNYALQIYRFNVEREVNWMDKRLDAYLDLEKWISDYDLTKSPQNDRGSVMRRAFLYGSDCMSDEIEKFWNLPDDANKDERENVLLKIEETIGREIAEQAKPRKYWRQFWRKG